MQIDPDTALINIREEVENVDAELAGQFYSLEDYYERKLWYQLSELLRTVIYKNPNSQGIRLKLFENFILSFGDKINQLQLVDFLVISLKDSTPQDSYEYLNNLKQRVLKLGETKSHNTGDDDINDYEIIQALIYLDNELAKVKLDLGFVDEAVSIIDESENKIDSLNVSVDNRVNASFYLVRAKLMKGKGDFNSFYYNSLLFLSCIPELEELQDKQLIVQDICISGLLGDKVFNFGEIIMHDIFQYLNDNWLKELLLSLNNGDLNTFNKLIANTDALGQYKDIESRLDFLRQKVCIMAFIELVFNKPTTSRIIQYAEIMEKIPLLRTASEVEYLVMRCASLKLVKALINQVEETVEVSWIQPRTMTLVQIENMKTKMETWNEKVTSLNAYLGECGRELFV